MIRLLIIIFVSGLLICGAAMGGAIALGLRDVKVRNAFRDEFVGWRPKEVADTPPVTSTFAWTGGETLEIDAPVDVEVIQGPAKTVTVTGPEQLVKRLVVEGGKVRIGRPPNGATGAEASPLWRHDKTTVTTGGGTVVVNGVTVATSGGETFVVNDGCTFYDDGGLSFTACGPQQPKVVITAPDIRSIVVNGSGDLTLRGYDQSGLRLNLSGSGDVQVQGSAKRVDVHLAGSGDVDLRSLAIEDADVAVHGSGDIILGPRESAHVTLQGSGDATLTQRPRHLEHHVSGSGELEVRGPVGVERIDRKGDAGDDDWGPPLAPTPPTSPRKG